MDIILLVLWFLCIAILAGRKVLYGHWFTRKDDPEPNFLGLFYFEKFEKK